MSAPDVIDLFAGPGGWSTGAASLGIREVGIEWDDAAVATAEAAGHDRVQDDIAAIDPRAFSWTWFESEVRTARGLIASPPCQGFSMAGKGKGRADSSLLLSALALVATRRDVDDVIRYLTPKMTDARTLLVLEPLRWALALTPSWLALEQVPGVLPLWEACADVLRRVGYSVATGNVQAEQYGVPQTRRRAILVARAPWFAREHGPARLPTPTHAATIESVLPHRAEWSLHHWRGAGMTERYGPRPGRASNQQAPTVTGHPTRLMWHHPDGRRERLGIAEASILQTFPAAYPWSGANRTQMFRQIGNAVPPLLARAILAEVAAIPTNQES